MAKSPAVLRATKQAIRHVRTMDFGQAYDYLKEKGQAIKAATRSSPTRPGCRSSSTRRATSRSFEPFKLGTMLTDQRK